MNFLVLSPPRPISRTVLALLEKNFYFCRLPRHPRSSASLREKNFIFALSTLGFPHHPRSALALLKKNFVFATSTPDFPRHPLAALSDQKELYFCLLPHHPHSVLC